MTVLRLTGTTQHKLAPAIVSLGTVTFARRGGSSYAQVPAAQARDAVRAFALIGVSAGPCEEDIAPGSGLRPARGLDLSPLTFDAIDLDVVRIERLALGPATREVLRPRLWGLLAPAEASRARCRALLHRDEAIFAWSRQAWGSRAGLRSGPARRVLRPIVFDRAAESGPLVHRTTSSGERLAAWLFA